MKKKRDKLGRFIKGIKYQLGYKHTEKTREKIRKARKRQGSNVWNKGTHLSSQLGKPRPIEVRRKIGLAQVGNKNHNWKNGITSLRGKIWKSFEYRRWRSDILTRDDFECQLCGVKGGKLAVDHFPVSFSEIIKKNSIDILQDAYDCKELWNINNGRTLCKECHLRTNSYGGRNNKK